ncbi:MAG: dethiobiotin synthase [Bacteroidetes bacterium]|nr:dethiobiotin synthase [Bacteroidota bacterium]
MKNNSFFVTGIDTNIGKTVVAAILVEALNADYWKPIQSGDLHYTDTDKVKELVNEKSILYPETYRLNNPLSPHASAKLDNISISLASFQLPKTNNNLIVEGAGGLLVPINEDGSYLSDIIVKLGMEVILVSKNYLGSINHTLLSIEYLKSKSISIKGIIIVGEKNESSESIITKNTEVNILHRVPMVESVTREFIKEQAELLKSALN